MVVSKQWFEFGLESKFLHPVFNLNYTSFLPLSGSEKGVFWKRGLFRKVHLLEILENLEILEFLENHQTVEN